MLGEGGGAARPLQFMPGGASTGTLDGRHDWTFIKPMSAADERRRQHPGAAGYKPPGAAGVPKKPLSPAAERALAEAAARRAERERAGLERPKEVPDRGLDPTRYGDWEIKGIASDF
jgi:hypothetical protein